MSKLKKWLGSNSMSTFIKKTYADFIAFGENVLEKQTIQFIIWCLSIAGVVVDMSTLNTQHPTSFSLGVLWILVLFQIVTIANTEKMRKHITFLTLKNEQAIRSAYKSSKKRK